MSFFFWLMVILAVYGCKIRKNGYFEDYIGPASIQPIKGIFLISIISLLLMKGVDLLQKKCMPWEMEKKS